MMRKLLMSSLLWFWALSGMLSPVPSRGEDPSPGVGGQVGGKQSTWENVKGRAKEEMKAEQKDAKRAGQEIRLSTQELPPKAGKEFKNTGRALKNAGKEIKDNAKESFEEIKKQLKK